MTTKEEVKNTILDSNAVNWEYFDNPATYVYKSDRDLYIEKVTEWKDLTQDWASGFPNDDNHKRADFRIKYRGSPYFQYEIAAVDGYKGIFPIPQADRDAQSGETTWYHDEFDVALGRILTGRREPSEYDTRRDYAGIERRD